MGSTLVLNMCKNNHAISLKILAAVSLFMSSYHSFAYYAHDQNASHHSKVLEKLKIDVESVVEEGIHEAQKQEKPLLIVVFEDHFERSTLLVGSHLLEISKRLDFHVLTETNDDLIKHIEKLTPSLESPNFSFLLQRMETLGGIKPHSIDEQWQSSDMVQRNKAINKAIGEIEGSSVLFIGALHAAHILNGPCIGAEDLNKKFHILPINALSKEKREELYIDSKYPKFLLDFAFSDNVHQVSDTKLSFNEVNEYLENKGFDPIKITEDFVASFRGAGM